MVLINVRTYKKGHVSNKARVSVNVNYILFFFNGQKCNHILMLNVLWEKQKITFNG